MRSRIIMSKAADDALRYTTRRQMTVAKTFSRQHEVPRLPLPALEQTVEKYLKTIEPYAANKAELDAAHRAAKEFLADPEVRRRQAALEKLKEESVSYMERMWLDVGYHQWRAALPINSNVTGYLFGRDRKKWPMDWSAAAVSVGALNYHILLKDEQVPVNMAKDKPQSMDQYSRIFCLNRVPGELQDHFERDLNAKHIVVLTSRRMYSIKVLQEDGKTIIPIPVLQGHVRTVLQDARRRGDDPFPVAALSGGERTFWAKARARLQKLNPDSLREVESAIFAVSLDPSVDATDRDVAAGTLVGDGRNFWFDKSFNISVKGDGNPAIHIEHSWADAPVPLDMFFNHALTFAEREYEKGGDRHATKDPRWPEPKEIVFKLDDEVKASIRDVEAFTDTARADSDVQVVNCVGLGKPVWKQAGLSPDAAVQMAMQLAWRRMHGGSLPVATYETIGMTGFANGRTECCRVVSSKSEAFVQSMLSGYIRSRSEADRVKSEKALREACDAHLKYIVEGQQGKGVDRHMLALRLQSKDGSQPALFKDPLFARSGSTGAFYLSTSNNSYIPRPFGGMFGSGMPDGYGVCYIPRDDGVVVCVESKRSCETTDSLRFCKMVNECLMDVARAAGVPLPASML